MKPVSLFPLVPGTLHQVGEILQGLEVQAEKQEELPRAARIALGLLLIQAWTKEGDFTCAEHDVLYGAPIDELNPEQVEILVGLGWHCNAYQGVYFYT